MGALRDTQLEFSPGNDQHINPRPLGSAMYLRHAAKTSPGLYISPCNFPLGFSCVFIYISLRFLVTTPTLLGTDLTPVCFDRENLLSLIRSR